MTSSSNFVEDSRSFDGRYEYDPGNPHLVALGEHILCQPRPEQGPLVVGVQARTGAGKTTLLKATQQLLAQRLGVELDAIPVFGVDDVLPHKRIYDRGPWPHIYDLPRLARRLDAAKHGALAVRYTVREWTTDTPVRKRAAFSCGVMLLDGVCALAKELRPYIHVPVELDTDPDTAFHNSLVRSGPEWRQHCITWRLNDDDFVRDENPHEYIASHPAGFVFPGAGRVQA